MATEEHDFEVEKLKAATDIVKRLLEVQSWRETKLFRAAAAYLVKTFTKEQPPESKAAR